MALHSICSILHTGQSTSKWLNLHLAKSWVIVCSIVCY